jgi:hypothetical protein
MCTYQQSQYCSHHCTNQSTALLYTQPQQNTHQCNSRLSINNISQNNTTSMMATPVLQLQMCNHTHHW